jgi:hypothetical protein
MLSPKFSPVMPSMLIDTLYGELNTVYNSSLFYKIKVYAAMISDLFLAPKR